MKGYVGIQQEVLTLVSSSKLSQNRLVDLDKTTGIVSYASYGSKPFGILSDYSSESAFGPDAANIFYNTVWPIGSKNRTAFIRLAGSVSCGDKLFPVANGCVTASSASCVTRKLSAQPSNPAADCYYLLPASVSGAAWTGHANALAKWTLSGTTWSFTEVSASLNLGLTVYCIDDGRFYTWNGTAWVTSYARIFALSSGIVGDEIACFVEENLNFYKDVDFPIVGQYSGTPGSATITILDARIVAGDKILATVQGSTNASYIVKVVATSGTITITMSADPGASTVVTYMIVR